MSFDRKIIGAISFLLLIGAILEGLAYDGRLMAIISSNWGLFLLGLFVVLAGGLTTVLLIRQIKKGTAGVAFLYRGKIVRPQSPGRWGAQVMNSLLLGLVLFSLTVVLYSVIRLMTD